MHCYTIGHSNHQIEEFIDLLKKYEIDTIIDVRSYPFSQHQFQFNQDNLERFLKNQKIGYYFFGNGLGGRYKDPEYLFPDGIVNYNKVKERPQFKEYIKKVEQLIQSGKHLALLCSEKDPFDCHRFVLISRILDKEGVQIDHILYDGDVISQESMENRLRNFYSNCSSNNLESLYEKRNRDIFNKSSQKKHERHQKRSIDNVSISNFTPITAENKILHEPKRKHPAMSNMILNKNEQMITTNNSHSSDEIETNIMNNSIKEPDSYQIKVYTIGFTQKSAQKFFETLSNNGIKLLIDIRLNNKSQLAGFTKADDLKYFLKKICGIDYIHMPLCAPSDDLLKRYQKKEINWQNYEKEYFDLVTKREVQIKFDEKLLNKACFLCSEPKPDQCHRRLLVEYLKKYFPNLEIIHL